MSEWERVAHRGQTVYWRRRLPDGTRLAVSRPNGRADWTWTHYGPKWDRTLGHDKVLKRSHESWTDTRGARRAADHYVATLKVSNDSDRRIRLDLTVLEAQVLDNALTRAALSNTKRLSSVKAAALARAEKKLWAAMREVGLE